MSEFDTAEKIIEAFNTEEGKTLFLKEWNTTPTRKENFYKETLRYKVLSAYWENPEGAYKDVINLLEKNSIPLRRNSNPIYALDDDEVVGVFPEEINIFFQEQEVFDSFYKADVDLENPESVATANKYVEKINKATKMYVNNPKLFGRLLGGKLIDCNHHAGLIDNVVEIAKATKRIPYSSERILRFLNRIIQNDDVETLEKIKEVNPHYFNDIGKVPFYKTRYAFPDNIGGKGYRSLYGSEIPKYGLIENILSTAFDRCSPRVIDFLLKNTDVNLSGEVDSCEADVPASIKHKTHDKWDACRYNLYKIRAEAFKSNNNFTPNKYSSLLFNMFVSHLDQEEPILTEENKNYLDKAISSGAFIRLLNDNVKSWESSERGNLKLDERIDYNSDIRKGNTPAYKILFQIKEARKIIYENAGKILKNESDPKLKSQFFNLLIEHSRLENDKEDVITRDVELKYPSWQPGKNLDSRETLIEVISNNLHYIKDISLGTTTEMNRPLLKILNKNISNQESELIVDTAIKLSQNTHISTPNFILQEDNLLNKKKLKIVLSNDLTFNGTVNPLYSIIKNNEIEPRIFNKDEEAQLLRNDLTKQEKYIQSFKKIMDRCLKNRSIMIATPALGYYKDDTENILSSSLHSEHFGISLGQKLFWKTIDEEHIGFITQGDLLNKPERINEKIKTQFFKTLNSNVDLTSTVQIKDKDFLENVITKLHKSNFDFSMEINSTERAYVFMKIFYVIENEDILKSLYDKYQPLIQHSLNKCATEPFYKNKHSETIEENILNTFQNEKFFKLFSNGLNAHVTEKLVCLANSYETYKSFLTHTDIEIVSEKHNLLWDAINNQCYGSVKALLSKNRDLLAIPNEKGKLPLEVILRDLISFSTKDGKYENKQNAQFAEDCVNLVYDYDYSNANLSKKSTQSLLNVISTNKWLKNNEEKQAKICSNLLSATMHIKVKDTKRSYDEPDLEDTSFKI